jgi:O-acetylserine/cysteine efflux transporter
MSGPWQGFVFIVLGAFFWALYSALLKRLPSCNQVALVVWIGILSSPFLVLMSFITDSGGYSLDTVMTLSWSSWAALLYMTFIASLIGHSLWTFLMARCPATVLAPMVLLVPVFGIIGSVLLLGEPFTVTMGLATAIVLLSLALGTWKKRH